MANLDNGLPPANTELTGKKVSDVNIDSKEHINSQDMQGVHDVNIQQKNANLNSKASIHDINIQQSGAKATAIASSIQAVNIHTDKSKLETNSQVNDISIEIKQAGVNRIMYM